MFQATDSSSEDKTPVDVEHQTRENAETDSCPVEPAPIQLCEMSQQQCQQHVDNETEEQKILAHQEEYNEQPYNSPGILKSDRELKSKKKKTADEIPDEKQEFLEKQRYLSKRCYQRRSPEMREARRKKKAHQRMNETEEEREARLEKRRQHYQAHKVQQRMYETEEKREARLKKNRKNNQAIKVQRQNETEEEREARREKYRQYYRARKRRLAQLKNSEPNSGQRGRGRKRSTERPGILETFENGEIALKKPKRLAKLTAEEKIRLCLEHKYVDLEAYLKIRTVPDVNQSLETLEDGANLDSNIDVPVNQSDSLDLNGIQPGTDQEFTTMPPDLCAEDYPKDASSDMQNTSRSMESERSMTLEEKWGLRPLFIRLKRIDLEDIIKKLKYESPASKLNDKTCHKEKENN